MLRIVKIYLKTQCVVYIAFFKIDWLKNFDKSLYISYITSEIRNNNNSN